MSRITGWGSKGDAEQNLEKSGELTIFTFPESQKSITVLWKGVDNQENSWNFSDNDYLKGVFYYDNNQFTMSYASDTYHLTSRNSGPYKSNTKKGNCASLPCKYLVLAITQPEKTSLRVSSSQNTCSFYISRHYISEPGDFSDVVRIASLEYVFDTSEMICTYHYHYHIDTEP